MAKLSKWVQKAVGKFLDPGREERVEELVRVLHNGLRTQKQNFSAAKAVQDLGYNAEDLEIAKEKLYRKILAKGWGDEQLTQEEQGVARWVARSLGISLTKETEINREFACNYFATALAEAMEDGILDEHEEARLQRIAASAGSSLPQFARTFFRSQAEGFLRGVFLACVDDNRISQSEWDYLRWITERLGLTWEEFLEVVQPQSRQFVEHVLADAKSDGRLSDSEEETLGWLVNNLKLAPEFRQYVRHQVSILRTLNDIADGKLPTVVPPEGVGTRAGELVHWHIPAIWRQVRMLKSGPRTNDHHGTLILTDCRLIFSSPTKSQAVNYRKIVFHRGDSCRIETQVEGKPASTFYLEDESGIPYAVLGTAVAMANQTVVAKVEGSPTRHIPREVRQRVWQRYGGQCAECSAKDYLEFDHIVPVARGGSNSEANVQLLCRHCNLKKSDHI